EEKMGKSPEKVMEERDRQIFLQGASLVRDQGYTVSWSLETIDEINELLVTDGFKLYVEPDGYPDVYVVLQKDSKEVGRRRVYIVEDTVFVDK
ncbi:hypothetical protein V7182_23740, partial [Neobacillus drentensis]|uniref:hypothetical protein n=1 Tax=Neobacillus drentensis TaxID=220684 RepID=UPI002FFEB517